MKRNYTQQVITTPGAGNFTVPSGVYGLIVDGTGGGGAGSAGVNYFSFTGSPFYYGGVGGGGSGTTRRLIKVTPGQVIPYYLGSGGSSQDGGYRGSNTPSVNNSTGVTDAFVTFSNPLNTLAQSFQWNSVDPAYAFATNLKRIGSPVAQLVVDVYTWTPTGGVPGAATGVRGEIPLLTSFPRDAAIIQTASNTNLSYFTFPPNKALVSGNYYIGILRCQSFTTFDGSNNLQSYYNSASAYVGGAIHTGTVASASLTGPGSDLNFIVQSLQYSLAGSGGDGQPTSFGNEVFLPGGGATCPVFLKSFDPSGKSGKGNNLGADGGVLTQGGGASYTGRNLIPGNAGSLPGNTVGLSLGGSGGGAGLTLGTDGTEGAVNSASSGAADAPANSGAGGGGAGGCSGNGAGPLNSPGSGGKGGSGKLTIGWFS